MLLRFMALFRLLLCNLCQHTLIIFLLSDIYNGFIFDICNSLIIIQYEDVCFVAVKLGQ